MRFTIDSNILVYAFDRTAGERHDAAAQFMILAELADCVIAAQALGEFMTVVRRKQPRYFDEAFDQVARWQVVFPILDTMGGDILRAAAFAERLKIQFWDSLIWQVARSADTAYFITEDMQDGLVMDGMTVVDPFNSANQPLLRNLLRGRAEIL